MINNPKNYTDNNENFKNSKLNQKKKKIIND